MKITIFAGAKLTRTTGIFCSLMGLGAGLIPTMGCAATHAGETADTTKPVNSFTIANNAQKVTVNVDDVFEVSLESNASTGYEWSIVTQNTKIIESDGKPRFVIPQEAPPGTPAQQVFRFKAKSAGNTKLVLHYARPWEKDKEPAEKFSLEIAVNKAKE